jgi:hypothetical protein
MRLPWESVSVFVLRCCAGLAVVVGISVADARGAAAGVAAGVVPADVEPTGATDDRTELPEATLTGAPPPLPPPMFTTRVDRIDVFPDDAFFEPSCNGMISLREPLSRIIFAALISVIVYP